MKYVGSSADRYLRRQATWQANHRVLPRVRHHGWWLAHNALSHPLLALRASRSTVWFHDWTSKHLNQREEMRPSPLPVIQNRGAWVFHNVLGHIAIGLVPVDVAFRFHDRTAAAMNEPNWV